MSAFDILVTEATPCDSGELCRNSPENAGQSKAKCTQCRLSPNNPEYPTQHWSPMKGAKHPILEKEKRDKRISKNNERVAVRRAKDKGRQRVLKLASRAEKQTERNIIRATKNSGRSYKDGDHVSAGSITLDTKLQSQRENPIVLLHELEKVRKDAVRAGQSIGGLVLRNKNGVGVVVFSEEDYAILAATLIETEITDESENKPRSGQG